VTDLRRHLQAAGAKAPFVLVGHSFGGMVMQLYARLAPIEVRALVLIDSVHENQVARFYEFSQLAGDGLVEEIAEVLPGVDYATGAEQLRQAPLLRRHVPLTVVSRGRETDVAVVWAALQAELARQSDRSEHIVAANSGHGIQFDAPEIVVSAIRKAISGL
jgi:pimeloyl-ACP methyl ester carboxylesterase